jgi:stringent starvation protein B
MSEHEIRHADPREGFNRDEPRAKSILILAIVSVILLIVVIVGVSAYFQYIYQDAVFEKVLSAPGEQLKALRDRENAQLTQYSYTDKQKGLVRIPVDRAMELFAQEAAAGKLFYPAKSYVPKKEEPVATPGAPAGTPGAPAPPSVPETAKETKH